MDEQATIRAIRESPWNDPLSDRWNGTYVVRLADQPDVDHLVAYLEWRAGDQITRTRAGQTACGAPDPGEAGAPARYGSVCPACRAEIGAAFRRLEQRCRTAGGTLDGR